MPTRCTCGHWAIAGTKQCSRCREIEDLRMQGEKCKIENRRLKSENHQLTEKNQKLKGVKDHPFRLIIQGWEGTCSQDYLDKLLRTIGPVTDVVKVKYERRG